MHKETIKNKVRLFICFLMTLCLTVSGLSLCTGQAYAASKSSGDKRTAASSSEKKTVRKAKASITYKKLKLRTGRKKVIRIKNAGRRVKWTTSNRKIARIVKRSGKYKQKVTIKAGKKTGTCVIKARMGRKIFKCRVTVKKKKSQGSGIIQPIDPFEEKDREIEIRPLSSSSVRLSSGTAYKPGSDKNMPKDFAKAVSGFAIRLLRETQDSEKDSKANILVSPDSVLTCLALLANGADNDTLAGILSTADPSGRITLWGLNQYLSGIHGRLAESDMHIYQNSNSVWARKGKIRLSDRYVSAVKKHYDAEVYEADFSTATVRDMNNWVYNKTRNMINKIIDRLDPDDRAVLINAVAFEGKWADQFSDGQIVKNSRFTCSDGRKAKVTMLTSRLSSYNKPYIELNGGKGLAKAYRGGEIYFAAFLPPEGTSIEEYIKGITGAKFINAWNSRQSCSVDIKIPEFSYDYDAGMKKILSDMGMGEAFSDDADFSSMTASGLKEVKVDDILHKTHIELDRNGTKAAAVTAAIMKANSALVNEEPKKVYLDRPFVYALVDGSTGIPLFIGTVREIN